MKTPNYLPKFNIRELVNINFGKVEGEKDDKLKESFYPTRSIIKLLKGKYNYVLSPKGGGKSSIFKAIKDKLVPFPKNIFDYKHNVIISINEAFGFDNDYLNPEHFKRELNRKNYTISWAVYLIVELIRDIQLNHKDKKGYSTFISKIKRIEGFRKKFHLYDISDFVNQLSIGLIFSANGQQIDLRPKFNFDPKIEELDLNEIFQSINQFYNENKLTALILIDRLDNFVRREEYNTQKNYLQGLLDCIEEISNCKNIHPILFIRTDLFYSYEIDFEYDKIKERTINLDWGKDELINLVIYRLLANPYLQTNYYNYFRSSVNQEIIEKIRIKNERWYHHPLFILISFPIEYMINYLFEHSVQQKAREKEIKDLKWETPNYIIAQKFIHLFFPTQIKYAELNFISWISQYLCDSNSFTNPRILIYFLNELINAQIQYNSGVEVPIEKELTPINYSDYAQFQIFTQNIIKKAYEKIQNDELINVFKMLKDKKHQALFREINEKSFLHGRFKFSELSPDNEITKEDYTTLIKHLTLLGYCKEIEKFDHESTFEIPKLFQFKMILNHSFPSHSHQNL